jgi:hypothetical protein
MKLKIDKVKKLPVLMKKNWYDVMKNIIEIPT